MGSTHSNAPNAPLDVVFAHWVPTWPRFWMFWPAGAHQKWVHNRSKVVGKYFRFTSAPKPLGVLVDVVFACFEVPFGTKQKVKRGPRLCFSDGAMGQGLTGMLKHVFLAHLWLFWAI